MSHPRSKSEKTNHPIGKRELVPEPLLENGCPGDISKERRFGQRARRLVKLVSRAFLNPGMTEKETNFQP
jgi:hypothetical protein